MIFTERKITVNKGQSTIDRPVILYRGDYEVEIRFTIVDNDFKYINGNINNTTEKASHAQLAILGPDGTNVFSDISVCTGGQVAFVLTKEMIDELSEVGKYSFQIRLFDYYRESRVSIPPVEYGIEVREPVASEDHTNAVDNSMVGYSIAKTSVLDEPVPETFDDNGHYNKTNWETGDRISEGKLNKIEDAIDKINQNEITDIATVNNRITSNYNVLNSIKASNDTIWSMANMGQDVKEAMTGGSVAVVGENAVDTGNIRDKSITSDKIYNQFLYNLLFYEDSIIPDFSFNYTDKILTLTLPATCYLMVGHKYTLVGENNKRKIINIPFPNNHVGVTSLWWSAELREFQLINYGQHGDLNLPSNKEKYLIATIGIGTSNNPTVVMPGRYTINGNSRIYGACIDTNNIKNNSIIADDLSRQIQPVRIFGNGKISANFTQTGLELTCPNFSYMLLNSIWYEICRDATTYNIPYPSTYSGINLLCFDLNNKGFIIVNHTEINYVRNNINNIIILGTVGIGDSNSRSLYLPADFEIGSNEPSLQSKEFFLTFDGEISVNTYNKKIRIPRFFVQQANMGYRDIKGTACGLNTDYFEYSYSSGFDIYMICLNYDKVVKWDNNLTSPNENPIEIYTQGKMPSASSLKNNLKVIATSIFGHVTSEYNLDVLGGPKNLEWASFNSRKPIDFDWSNKQITYSQGYIHYRNTYIIPGKNVNGTNTIPITVAEDGIQWLLFNIEEKTFRTYRYAGDSIDWNQRWVIIATFWINGGVQTLSQYSINGKLYGIDSSNEPVSPTFSLDDNRLLLPDTMYLVKGESLPLYLSSITPDPSKISNVNPTMVYSADGRTRSMDTFTDGYDMDSDKLYGGFTIGYSQNVNNTLYYKNIDTKYCDPAAVTNKKPTILHIGDSITNRYVALKNEGFLKAWGITPTYVGTINNQGSRRGEGREGWEYTNFIGMNNIWGNNNSIIKPDVSSTTTDLNLNPFVKVATANDKAKYPDWCFTYTSSLRETSYTNADDKTQTFYIFDIANYLSAHSVSTPDIITIALSTNDINRRSDYLETCLFSMDVMISRIREQLPNVKIGMVPSPAWGHGNNTFKSKTAVWIEKCITAINARNDDKLFVIPIWCHMHRQWGFDITGTNISDANNSKSGTISDTIHPNGYGQDQYGKAMAMFIANML